MNQSTVSKKWRPNRANSKRAHVVSVIMHYKCTGNKTHYKYTYTRCVIYRIRSQSQLKCCLPVQWVLDLSQGTERRSKQAAGDIHSKTWLCATATALSAGILDVRLLAAVQSHLWCCTAIHQLHNTLTSQYLTSKNTMTLKSCIVLEMFAF